MICKEVKSGFRGQNSQMIKKLRDIKDPRKRMGSFLSVKWPIAFSSSEPTKETAGLL